MTINYFNLLLFFFNLQHNLVALASALKQLLSVLATILVNLSARLLQSIVFIVSAVSFMFWVQCFAILFDRYFVMSMFLQLAVLLLFLGPVGCWIYKLTNQVFFDCDLGEIKQRVVCGFVVCYVTNKVFNLCVMLSMFVMMRMVLWGALGVFETGCMYFTDGVDGSGSTGNSGSFNSAGGPDGGSTTILPVVDTQNYKEQPDISDVVSKSISNVTPLPPVLKIKNIDTVNSFVTSSLMRKESDYDFIEFAKIIDVQDRSLYHSKFVPVRQSIAHYPFEIRRALCEGTLRSDEWQEEKMEALYFEAYKKTNAVHDKQHTTIIKPRWLTDIASMREDFKLGNHSKIKSTPYAIVRENLLDNPILETIYTDISLVETKRIFFLQEIQVAQGNKTLHNHSGTEVTMFCKTNNLSWAQLRYYQFLTSSSFHGENSLITNVNYSSQQRDQYLTSVFCVVNDSKEDSPLIAVPDVESNNFVSEQQYLFKTHLAQAWKKGVRCLTPYTGSYLKNL